MTLVGLFNLCVAIFCFTATLINIKEDKYNYAFITTVCTCANVFAAFSTSIWIK